jgi:hypothetical protein
MFRFGGRGAAALLVFICAFAGAASSALAQTPIVLPAGDSPVVRVMMRSGNLTIRTWNRSDVQVTSAQSALARSFRPEAVARALSGTLPIFATGVFTPDAQIMLPQEEFALTPLAPGAHEGVIVQALDADVTVMIPADTALLLANVQRGRVDVQDYRNGNFVLLLHNGPMLLSNTGGAGYAQVARGPLVIRDSAFDRIRARTAIGNIVFENCNSRQIQVSSVNGTIVYDNGSFEPGLARFESENGNIALGVPRDGAQIGAHSSVGRIYSMLGGASVRAGQTDAQLGSGRPVVTASSSHGAVFVYNGTLRSQRRLPAEWRALAAGLRPRPIPGGKPRGRIH